MLPRRSVTVALSSALLLVSLTAIAKDKKKDPDEIGNRDVGKGRKLLLD